MSLYVEFVPFSSTKSSGGEMGSWSRPSLKDWGEKVFVSV